MNDFKLYSMNWQDGMLLTMNHLREQDRYFEELGRWYSAGVGYGFGLVRRSASSPPLKIDATVSGNRLRVELKRCQALLPCGMFVEFNEEISGGSVLKAEADINETRIPVFLGVGPGEKTQVGEPDPSEEIPRIPYEIPDYSITLLQPPNLSEDRYFKIAELAVNGSEVSEADDYFPPCVDIHACDRLASLAVDYRNRMENLLKLSTRAFMAVSASGGPEGASTSLQGAFRETTHYLVYHLSSHLDDFQTGRNSMHPSRMMVQFKKLFRVVSSLLNMQPGLKDYLNAEFFSKEVKSDIGSYLSSVDAFLLSEYNHRDIASQVKMVDGILGVLRALMAFLSQTKLESMGEQAVATETITYRTKTYRNIPIASSRLEKAGELSYLVMELDEPCPMDDAVALLGKGLFKDDEWLSLQVRLGLNEARGLGETDPVDIDLNTYGNKVVLHPLDMLKSASVSQVTLILRGMPDTQKLASLGTTDLILYATGDKG